MEIAVVGSNMVDLISYINRMPTDGETVEAPDFHMGCGGKGANQAVAASRMGSKVLMVTRVGNDVFAENTINNFEKNGIDSKFVMRTDATSGVAPIFVDPQSRNSIIIVKGANAKLKPNDVEKARSEISKCKLIVLQLEIPLETVYATIRMGAELGVPVLLNPAPADPALSLENIRNCEFIVPNESELSLLTGMPVDTSEDITNAARMLLQSGIPNVIVTLGSKGALLVNSEGEKMFKADAQSAQNAVDTTGAGNAFIGCFSHTWVKTHDIEASIKAANIYAGDAVTKRGTQLSYATAEEVGLE